MREDADDDEEPAAQMPLLAPALNALEAVHAISTDAAVDGPDRLPGVHRNSGLRANRILGRIVPLLLLAFILNGWFYMQTEMGGSGTLRSAHKALTLQLS